jgi:hypothetical protein
VLSAGIGFQHQRGRARRAAASRPRRRPRGAAPQRAQVVRRPGRDRPDVSAFLALFEHKIRDQSRLSLPEVQAIAAYLSTSVAEFAVFSHADAVLKAR